MGGASWEEYCDEQEAGHKCHIVAVFELKDF